MTLYSIVSRRETLLLISAGCGYLVGRLSLGVNKVEGAGSGLRYVFSGEEKDPSHQAASPTPFLR